MQENTWKTWMILAVIGLGGMFELFKHLPGSKSPLFDKENLHFSTEDDTPYSVRPADRRKHRADNRAVHVAANQKLLQEEMKKFEEVNAPKQTDSEHKDANPKDKEKDKDKAKKKANDDEYEIVIDPVTGKKVRRKKKKEEAKKEEKPIPVAKPTEVIQPNDNKPIEEPHAPVVPPLPDAGSIATNQPNNPNNNDPDRDKTQSLQEWQRALLNRPDPKETKQFIQGYKSHNVSSDVYYKIATMMIQDSRPEMKQLGLMVVGAAPSTTSFQLLVGVAKGNSSTPQLQQQANQLLTQYTQPQNLIYLQGALRGSDRQSATVAAQLLDTSVQQALQQQQQSLPNPDPRVQESSLAATNRQRYQPFVSILTQLAQNGQDATLAAQARQTLTDLQMLLGTGSPSNVALTP